jgi:predicted secreted hydrolase
MAFRIRRADGSDYWTGGAIRDASGASRALDPGAVRFTPQKHWRSPRTGIDYPIAFRVEAGQLDITLAPLFEDQELDSRASVGTVYWKVRCARSPAAVKGTRLSRAHRLWRSAQDIADRPGTPAASSPKGTRLGAARRREVP